MVTTTKALISDEEIERVHANANFGGMLKRRVIDDGVLKYAMGYTSGATQLAILMEHGLVRRPRTGDYGTTLTRKGRDYLRAMVLGFGYDSLLNALSPANDDVALSDAA